jgi:hypothetical protein
MNGLVLLEHFTPCSQKKSCKRNEDLARWNESGAGSNCMERSTSDCCGIQVLLFQDLCFVATKNSGSTLPREPYQARFIDDFQSLLSRPVDQPEIISAYFNRSNGIDKHNHQAS